MAPIASIKSADALDHWLLEAAQNVGYLSHQLPETFLKDVPGFSIEEFNAFFKEVVAGRKMKNEFMTSETFFQALLDSSMQLSRIDMAIRIGSGEVSTYRPLLTVRAKGYANHFYQMAAVILLNMAPYVSPKIRDTVELIALQKMKEQPSWQGLKDMLELLDRIFIESKIFQKNMIQELESRERTIIQSGASRNNALIAGGVAACTAIAACLIALKYIRRI